jgi:hypothetical protein
MVNWQKSETVNGGCFISLYIDKAAAVFPLQLQGVDSGAHGFQG